MGNPHWEVAPGRICFYHCGSQTLQVRLHKPPLASLGTYLGALYQRLRKRMGHKKAIIALAHRILISISHLLKEQQPYRELGPGHAEEQANEASKRWALRRLQQLGYQITLQSVEVA
jgi:hypothetical protein